MSGIDIAYLSLISENDREFEAELLTVYLEDSELHLQLARAFLESGSWEELAKEAHHLKGASGNVGAKDLQYLAADLENVAKVGDLASINTLLDRMAEQFQAVKQLFRERYLP